MEGEEEASSQNHIRHESAASGTVPREATGGRTAVGGLLLGKREDFVEKGKVAEPWSCRTQALSPS